MSFLPFTFLLTYQWLPGDRCSKYTWIEVITVFYLTDDKDGHFSLI